MSANIDGLLNSGKTSLRQGDKTAAQAFFMKITELEPHNAEAWLWLAQAVETTDEQNICLENVLIIDPDNVDATRMLEELKRGGNISIPQNHPFGGIDDFNTLQEDPFAVAPADDNPSTISTAFDDPFGQPVADTPFGKPMGNDDPFGKTAVEDTSFSTTDDNSSFDDDGPFSAGLNNAPSNNNPAPTKMSSNLFDDTALDTIEDDQPRNKITHDDVDNMLINDTSDSYADMDDSYYEDSYEDDDLVDDIDAEPHPLDFIPEGIKKTRIPGTNEKVNMGLVTGISILGVLNLVAVIAIILQVVL